MTITHGMSYVTDRHGLGRIVYGGRDRAVRKAERLCAKFQREGDRRERGTLAGTFRLTCPADRTLFVDGVAVTHLCTGAHDVALAEGRHLGHEAHTDAKDAA